MYGMATPAIVILKAAGFAVGALAVVGLLAVIARGIAA
ncbi:ABC-type phosphate transport system auxiliary subunit [Bradyrhizobium diazoefficiens]|jgi:hypothetical protein